MISATLASSRSRSSVSEVAAETSSRKSSSSLRSRKRTALLRLVCMGFRRKLELRARHASSGRGGFHDLDAGAGADASGAGRGHGAQIAQRANAAGSFDTHARPDYAAHQGHIVGGGAGGAETGRSLDEIRAGLLG